MELRKILNINNKSQVVGYVLISQYFKILHLSVKVLIKKISLINFILYNKIE